MTIRHKLSAAVSAVGLALLMHFEGYRGTAYQDEAGVWTICYGHTAGVYKGMTATKAQCEVYLREDLKWAERVVDKYVKVPLNSNQFDALTMFVFNVGEANFKNSTMLKRINSQAYVAAGMEFPKWNKLRSAKTGQLVESRGLSRRRMAEMELYFKED